MRITMLTPGTGHFYCGNCLRENTLAQALKKLGHDVTMIPLYLPLFTEGQGQLPTNRVFMGGINLYLQHKLPLWRSIPGFLSRILDAPGLLRWSSRHGDMTDAPKHADLTLAMLRCDDAGQVAEVRRMIRWMKEHDPPDVISLCNVLLTGLAAPIKEEMDVPVVSTLQGEDSFIEALPEPKRTEAWRLLRANAKHIDAYIPVSRYYADRMSEFLEVEPERMHVIHNGISLDDMKPNDENREQAPPTIGYLARMCAEKGLPTLIDAFIELKRREAIPNLRLRVAGVMLKPDRVLVAEQEKKLRQANVLEHVEFLPNIPRETKLDFLHSLDVLSVPATYGEAFGLYLLEAMACGIPVVQPRHGAFPEIIDRTQGGLLCEPDDASSLADGIERLLTDQSLATSLSQCARQSVVEQFNSQRMAGDVAAVYHGLLQRESAASPAMTASC